MKKAISKLFMVATGLTVFSACSESEYDLENLVPNEYHKILYINKSGLQDQILYQTGEDATYRVSIIKGGSEPWQTANVSLEVMTQSDVDDKYGMTGIDYRVLPAENYSIGGTASFTGEDRYKEIDVTLKTDKIGELMASQPSVEWVLPLKAVSVTDSVNSNKDHVMIHVTDVVMPRLGFRNTSKIVTWGTSDVSEDIPVALDVNNQWDFTCEVVKDDRYVDEYNAANGSHYKPLPAEFASQITFAAGSQGALGLKASVSALEKGEYMLALRLQNPSKFAVSDQSVYTLFIHAPELDRSGWSFIASTEEQGGEGATNGYKEAAFDGDLGTFWHSSWANAFNGVKNPPLPHYMHIDLGSQELHRVGLVNRQGNPYVREGEFYMSDGGLNDDEATWVKVGTFNLPQNADLVQFAVEPLGKRYLHIKITGSYNGSNTSFAEIYGYGF